MRSIWKGSISFGLVSSGVKLYTATEERDVSFHQVRRTDGSRELLFPNQVSRPEVGVEAVASIRSNVVLPEPFGPIMPTTSPALSVRLIPKTPFPPP